MNDPENMLKHPRLTRRGNLFWFRTTVPQNIVATWGKREETFSLKTKGPREALRLVRMASVDAVDHRFEAQRRKLANP